MASRNWSRRKALKRLLQLRRWANHYMEHGGVLIPKQWYRLHFTLAVIEQKHEKVTYPEWWWRG